MAITKEFDRSVCYQHFEEFHEQIMRVKEMYGVEKAFNVYQAIAEYGLYQTEITDDELLILVGESVIRGIDRSQRKRARSFSVGEDMDMTIAVIRYHLDHPKDSQNKISSALGISKGKVNSTLKNYRSGKYSDIDFSNSISSSNSHSISSSYSKSTDDRCDRLTDKSDQDERMEIEEVLNLYRQGFSYKRDAPQIQDKTGLPGQRIHYIIENYKDDENFKPKKKVIGKTPILDMKGNESGLYREDFEISRDDSEYFFKVFTDKNGQYQFDLADTTDWFKEMGYLN